VFSRSNLHANPLIARVLRQDQRGGRTLQMSLRAAFALGLMGLAWGTWRTLNATSNEMGSGMGLVVMTGWLLHLAMPLITASAAAAFTRHAIQTGDFELLLMTPISNEALVQALVFTALFRMRYGLALMIAFMPLLVVEMFFLFIAIETMVYYYGPGAPTYWGIVTPTLAVLVILVGLWGMTVLGAAVGVQTALARRHVATAALVAPASLFMIMACPSILCMISLPALPNGDGLLALCLVAGILAAILAGPYLITFSIMHTAADQWRR